MVGRGASSCQRNPPRNEHNLDTVNRARPAPRCGCARIPAGWSSADHQCGVGGSVLYAPPGSYGIDQLRLRADPCRMPAQRSRRGPAPGTTPTARSPRDARSSAGHRPWRNLATGGRAEPPICADTGSRRSREEDRQIRLFCPTEAGRGVLLVYLPGSARQQALMGVNLTPVLGLSGLSCGVDYRTLGGGVREWAVCTVRLEAPGRAATGAPTVDWRRPAARACGVAARRREVSPDMPVANRGLSCIYDVATVLI
jgi:hypothetical protein